MQNHIMMKYMSLIFSPHHPLHLSTYPNSVFSCIWSSCSDIHLCSFAQRAVKKARNAFCQMCWISWCNQAYTVEPAFLIRLGFMQHRVAMHFSANVFCNSRPPGRHHRPAGATTLSQLLCGLFDLYFYRPGLQRIFF